MNIVSSRKGFKRNGSTVKSSAGSTVNSSAKRRSSMGNIDNVRLIDQVIPRTRNNSPKMLRGLPGRLTPLSKNPLSKDNINMQSGKV